MAAPPPTPPALGEGFYPFPTERRGGAGDPAPEELGVLLQRREQDLLLAAELGKMLLEQNEELRGRSQALARDHTAALERLEQEKYELRRRLESGVAEWETRVAELEGDLAALRAQLGHQRLEQQDTSRESSQVAQELSEQNQRLAEQLSQAFQLEQRLQDELMALRVENRTLGMSSAEHAARTQSLQAENLMLQERKQELERQTRQLREETEAMQGLVETLHENLLLLRREVHEKELQVRPGGAAQRGGSAAGAVLTLHSSCPSPGPAAPGRGRGAPSTNTVFRENIKTFPVRPRGPPSRGCCPCPTRSLCPQLTLQHVQLGSLRGELESQRRLFQESDRDETLKLAVADRDEAIIRKGQMELELAQVSLERDSMSQQLLAAIRQKMALCQELEGWQDDMEFIIKQQLKLQWQQEGIPTSPLALSRTPAQAKTSPFFRRGNSAPNGTSFLSLFKKS
uniref:BICD family-like cargo adapter 2 n=1 Tax=Gopherus evgoodei TaxID=1825980 RepID=A0A8C5EZI0_9SAUR